MDNEEEIFNKIMGLGLVHTAFNCNKGFCEVQYKRTEQSFKINSVNAEWCNIQSCINLKFKKKSRARYRFTNK
ncbi:hypothetical protein BpHYR1_027787 [Brachionus plicatilis]|uniref:Uncharacterized protein n=1 Tax=Brachionus plicatilis TaxID=10195 RepID=A0A3M7RUZ4_BRAPC|nr:hypothetical protein BpHYR1_027787 [Brachionus plicatilis]